jgi:uncharacterized membrane protein YagU involved in acid resistance
MKINWKFIFKNVLFYLITALICCVIDIIFLYIAQYPNNMRWEFSLWFGLYSGVAISPFIHVLALAGGLYKTR